MCIEWGHGPGIRTRDQQVHLELGTPGGLPASGGRAGPHRSGSPRTSHCEVQEWGGWGPAHRPGALPLHSGPQENHRYRRRAPEGKEEAGWAGKKSCRPRCLGDAGTKGQKEEKPGQRWFFSGGWESREGRQPRKEKEGRDEEEGSSSASAGGRKVMSPGSPWPFPLSHHHTRPHDAGARPSHPQSPFQPALGLGNAAAPAWSSPQHLWLPSLQAAPQPASRAAAR